MKKKSDKKQYGPKSFLESLKDLGGGVTKSARKDMVGGVFEEAVEQLTGQKQALPSQGTLQPEKPLNLEKYMAEKEKKIQEEERRVFERRQFQEKTLYSAEQQRTALEIKAIQEELNKLAGEVAGLDQEIKTAAMEAVVEPGVYHLNFLQRLRKLIVLLKQRVSESKTWLAEWNAYCKQKRNFYWVQVKKSGTKFMLSSERYMATQAG